MINREIAPFREKDKAEVPLSGLTIAEDFGRAFVQSAVIAPVWNGLGQLVTGGHLPHVSIVNEKNAENNVADSWAQKFGGAIGMAADFHILGKLKIGPFKHVETANTLSLAGRCGQHFMRSAKQGAVYGAVFTESDPSNNMLYGRVANAGSQALTFGLLGGGSEALSGLKGLSGVKPGTLKNALSDMTIAGVAGVPAGAVGAVADATFNGHTMEAKDIQNAAIDFGIIGFALAGINHGTAALKSGSRSIKNSMSSALENINPQATPKTTEMSTAPISLEVISSDTTQEGQERIHQRACPADVVDSAIEGRRIVEIDPAKLRYVQQLESCLSNGYVYDAKKIMEMGLLGEAELRAEGIRSAAGRGLESCLSNGYGVSAKEIMEMGLLDRSTIDEIFKQSVHAGHITSVVRIGLAEGKDFNTIAKGYLGTSKLTDEEAGRLFEKMEETDSAWTEAADRGNFGRGAEAFGAARMLRYVFKANASPHEVLDGFGDVVRMFERSGLNAQDFYNNVLRQVNRDNAVDDTGNSNARLKAIASNYQDNFDVVMEKAKQYPEVVTVQDLAARFPDKASIFSSWIKLQQYSKLEHFIGRSELLPKIQELRLAGQIKRAKWLEALAFHPDSKVAKEPIEDFLLKDPTEFLERDDDHSSELHEYLKPSNYVEIPHLDLKAEELREALIDGSLDRLQVFTPMKVEYEVGGVDVASELKRALGSQKTGQRGEAQNPKKLFSEVNKYLKQDKLTIAEVLQGAEMSQELAVKIIGLLYNKEIGLSRPPDSFKLVVEIHKKSDPLAVVAGDDTASCMEFGSGKNNVYMFNPNDALFTVRLERSDGTQRTIAQSVLTKDADVRELVPTIVEKMKKREPMLNVFSEEGLCNGKAVIAADNVEVHPNYNSDAYKSALEGVYRDFFGRYVELYGEKENLQSDKVVVGLGYGDALESLPKEDNTYLPQAPVAYSDKTHAQVSRLSLIAPQTKAVKASVPTQLVRTMIPNSKAQAITELTFEDALPLSYLESKMYKEVPTLSQGLYDLENTLIAKDINNVAKGRQNLSFKYTDNAGKMRGYLLAYEGKVEMEGSEKPAIYIEDFASDSYLEAKAEESGDVGGKLLLKFAKSYKQNYLDKGNMMPIYMNARGTTSYALLMKHIELLGRKYGYRFEIEEVDTRKVDSTTMHDVLITPKRVESRVLAGSTSF